MERNCTSKGDREMNIENMTIPDWLIVIGLGCVGGMLNFLVTFFIKWLGEEADE